MPHYPALVEPGQGGPGLQQPRAGTLLVQSIPPVPPNDGGCLHQSLVHAAVQFQIKAGILFKCKVLSFQLNYCKDPSQVSFYTSSKVW